MLLCLTTYPQVYEVRQYPKSPRYLDLLPIVGPQSMLLTEGHVWKSQREAFNPGQHPKACLRLTVRSRAASEPGGGVAVPNPQHGLPVCSFHAGDS